MQPRHNGITSVVGRVASMIHFTPPICRGNTRKAEYSPLSAQGQLKALAVPPCECARLWKDLTRKKCEVRKKLGLSWLTGSLSNGVDHPDEADVELCTSNPWTILSLHCYHRYQEPVRCCIVRNLGGTPTPMSLCLTSDSIPLIYVYVNSLSAYWNAASPELSAPRQGHTTLFGKRSYQRDRYSEHKGRGLYVSVLSSKSLHF